jgi:hypothetical protein
MGEESDGCVIEATRSRAQGDDFRWADDDIDGEEGNQMRSRAAFDQLIHYLSDLRMATIERLRHAPSAEDVALKEKAEWAIGCLELCNNLVLIPSDDFVQIVSPVRTPSAEVRLVSDNESDNPCLWTELKPGGRTVRPSDGDVLVLRKGRVLTDAELPGRP